MENPENKSSILQGKLTKENLPVNISPIVDPSNLQRMDSFPRINFKNENELENDEVDFEHYVDYGDVISDSPAK